MLQIPSELIRIQSLTHISRAKFYGTVRRQGNLCPSQLSLAAVLPLSSFLFGLRYLLSGKHFYAPFLPQKSTTTISMPLEHKQ